MKHIVILTGSHLCHNPRVLKEATALAGAGYSVEVLGAWFEAILRDRDQELLARLPFKFAPVIDLTRSRVTHMTCRVRTKLGLLAFRFAGYQNRWQFGYAVAALRQAAWARAADLYIAHSESAIAAAIDLRRAGRRVGVDMEDWFSEDLLPEARKHRPIRLLRDLERRLLRQGAYSACPSNAMSEALAREYDWSRPTVIYNAFPWADRQSLDDLLKDRRDRRIPSVHWYSQTLGEGRGLEDLLAALPLMEHEVEIHLRGNPTAGFDSWLAGRVPKNWQDRVFVHGLVTNEDLLSRIAEHDIGFAGEMKYCRSRDLTVTNKILHYLLAGLAVVASDTTGQREVAEQAPDAVELYPSGDAPALATRLNVLLESPRNLALAKAAALRASEQIFCWERQQKVLLEAIHRAVSTPAA